MSAWGGGSSRESHKWSTGLAAILEGRERFSLWFKDRGNPWNPWNILVLDDPSSPNFVSASGSSAISVPASMADAALELQSIPMDDPVPTGSPSWDRAPEDMGPTRQFSESAGTLDAFPRAAVEGARQGGDSLDFSVPETVRGPSKVEFSSADSEGFHPDPSYEPGDLAGAGEPMSLPPTGPIPQIVSPEPSITALGGISALLFACRRMVRFKSKS